MNIASVIVDIPTQALDTPYSYAVPDEMLVGEGGRPAAVGCAVLVTLGGRKAVGYIVGLEEVVPSPDEGTDLWGTPQSAADLKQVEAVLSAPFFDEEGAACALWLAERYAAPLSECARLFTPPRAVPRIVRGRDGRWRVEEPAIGEVDDRWVTRGPAFDAFVPRKNAVKQQEVLAAVGAGDVRVAELSRGFGAVGSTLKALAAKGAVTVERRRRMRGMEDGASRAGAPAGGAAAPAPTAAPQLTEGQQAAVAAIEAARAAGDGRVVLVDGVTGSGKTEVYLQAIERTLAEGRRAIVLVPEISLTPQTVARFRGRFGDAVAVMHSRMSDGERYDQWDFIKSGAARVVVGARSALFTPAANVGLIVIDEEHEGSYKQDSSPRYHARDVAEWMMARAGGALVLGSATPSIEALYQVNKNPRWTAAALPERANGRPMPAIEVVDMAAEFASGSRAMFSGRLARALGEELRSGSQGGASAEPARLREVPSVPRLRLCARVPALFDVAHLPRTGGQARLPPLRLRRGRAAHLPRMRQPLPEEVRRRHPARGNRAAPALGRVARRGANGSHHPHGRRHHQAQRRPPGTAGIVRRRRCRPCCSAPGSIAKGLDSRRRHAGGRRRRRHPGLRAAGLPCRRAHSASSSSPGGGPAPGAPSWTGG